MPGAIVPLTLTGLAAGVQFDPARAMVPAATATGWQGFLPADGAVDLGWRQNHEAAEGALSFTSAEQTEVRVGAGLLRQSSQIAFRILQGRLPLEKFVSERIGLNDIEDAFEKMHAGLVLRSVVVLK